MEDSFNIKNLQQPRGLMLLFFTEMWERFSYYGMRALLVLFLVAPIEQGGWGWSKKDAAELYGWYTGLVYFTPLLGGYLADRYFGAHRCVVVGACVIALGHFLLAMESHWCFFTGLLAIILGTGFFKSNISTMVGQLYALNDARRDGGFTIFYMGINLGALIGPLVCGYLAEQSGLGWSYGFAAAGLGMLFGLLTYLYGREQYLPGIGVVPMITMQNEDCAAQPLTREERQRIWAIFILAFFVMLFWLAFDQAGSSMNLFAQERTDRSIPGFLQSWLGIQEFPASWMQSVNPAFILLLAPVFSIFWKIIAESPYAPSTTAKMALGLLLMSLGYVVLTWAAYDSDQGQRVSPMWLISVYFLQTCGELCLSPVGLAMVTRLAPVKFASLLMGMWFLANFVANITGGYLAGMLEAIERGEVFHLLGGQADFFMIFVITSLLGGLSLLLLSPLLKRLMHGRG